MAKACVASVDSVLNCKSRGFALQSKGNFLYSPAIVNSTMDSSTKMMEDGVVDSPPNRNAQPLRDSSPSLLKVKSTTKMPCPGSFSDSRSSHKLYNISSSSLLIRVVQEFLRLPSVFYILVAIYCHGCALRSD